MASNDFQTHLKTVFNCRDENDIPAVASGFLLDQPKSIAVNNYTDVDGLMNKALDRLFIEVNKVKSTEASRLGRLYTKPGGFSLKINGDVSPTTYRFVKAHEMAHTLAYNRSEPEPQRYFPNSKSEERLCDCIARHLLIPEKALNEEISRFFILEEDFKDEPITAISELYLVKPWQVVKRYIEKERCYTGLIASILWWRESSDTLRISDSISPQGIFIPMSDRSHKGEKINQMPWTTFETNEAVFGEEEIRTGSLRGRLKSACFHSARHVVQILRLDTTHLTKLSEWRRAHGLARSAYFGGAIKRP